MATTLKELIEDIEKDDLPTNEFTIEDDDPMVILGKINEVIASLKMIQDTISSSDTKAQEALTTAIQSLETANKALSSSNVSLETANQAIATANQAITTANTALQKSQNAVDTSNQANNTANTAETNSLEALRIAQEALNQVVQALGTKAYINNVLQDRLDFTEDPQTQINNILSQVETNTSDISTLTSDVEELGNKINTTNSNLNTINSNLNTETTARENADNNLQQQITTNLNSLNTEITNRKNADSNLQSQIDTEISLREKGDNDIKNTYIKIINQTLNNINLASGATTQSSTTLSGNPSLIIKMGFQAIGSNTVAPRVNFSTPFPNKCVLVLIGRLSSTNIDSFAPSVYQQTISTTGFQYFKQSQTDRGISWIAIGN